MHENQNEDEKTIQKIKESLDYLDSSVEVKKPDVMQLFNLVNAVEEKKSTSKNKQFITFILIAIAAICLEVFSYNRSIMVFAVIQALALLCVIPVLLLIRKRNRQVSH